MNFVHHFKGLLSQANKQWEDNILNGALNEGKDYHQGIGYNKAIRNVIKDIEAIASDYLKKSSSQTVHTTPAIDLGAVVPAPSKEETLNG